MSMKYTVLGVLSAVVALGAVSLPMSSYAAVESANKPEVTASVQVGSHIQLSIDNNKDTANVVLTPNNDVVSSAAAVEGNSSAAVKVVTNEKKYTLSAYAKTSSGLTAGGKTDVIAAHATPTQGQSRWCMYATAPSGGADQTCKALGVGSTNAQELYSRVGEAGTDGDIIPINIKATAAPTIANGIYSTKVVLLAATVD